MLPASQWLHSRFRAGEYMAAFNWFKWSSRQWCLFLPFAAALILLLPRDLNLTLDKWFLWLTAFLVLLYTVETQGLRFEMIRQNEMSVEPVIIATFQTKAVQKIASTFGEVIVLRNIGRGPALYIKVDNEAILTRELGNNWYISNIGTIDFIEPGGEVIISPTLRNPEQQSPEANTPHISKVRQKGDPTVVVKIRYEDIGGTKRESLIQMGDGGPKLIKHGRVT